MIILFFRFVAFHQKLYKTLTKLLLMKKISILGLFMLFVLVMVGCQSSSKIAGNGNLNSEYLKKIPHHANRIYVTKSAVSADKMCDELRNVLISKNHMIVIFEKESHVITNETKAVGHSAVQGVTFTLQEIGNDSQVEIKTQWKSGKNAVGFVFPVAGYSFQPDWTSANWEKNRWGIAFAESAAIANEIKNGIISYAVEPSELPWYNRQTKSKTELASK